MPNRTTFNERDKVDHSSHPTNRATKDDLEAPGGRAKETKDTDDHEREPASQRPVRKRGELRR